MSTKENGSEEADIYDVSLLSDAVRQLDEYQKGYLRSILPSRAGKKICPHFQKTKTCSFGRTCKFDHPLEDSPISVSLKLLLNSLASDDTPNFLASASKIAESSFAFINGRLDMELEENEMENAIRLGLNILRALCMLVVTFEGEEGDEEEEEVIVGDGTSYGRLVAFIDKIIFDVRNRLLDTKITNSRIHKYPDYKYVLDCIEGVSSLFLHSESLFYEMMNSKIFATDFASVVLRRDIDAAIEHIGAQQLDSYNTLVSVRDNLVQRLQNAFTVAFPSIPTEVLRVDEALSCFFDNLTKFDSDQFSEHFVRKGGILLCPFGSCANGLGYSSSVVDILLFMPDDVDTTNFIFSSSFASSNHSDDFDNKSMIDVCARITLNAGFNIKEIMKATSMSMIRLIEPELGSEIHLHFNRPSDLMNTTLIRKYCDFDSRVKKLILAVKIWCKARNCVGNGSFLPSNYAWSLLVIHFLQKGLKQPVLPKLLDPSQPPFHSQNEENCSQLFIRFFSFCGTNGKSSFRHVFNNCVVEDFTTFERKKDSDGKCSMVNPFVHYDVGNSQFNPAAMEHILNELRRSVYILNLLGNREIGTASGDEVDMKENFQYVRSFQNVWLLLCEELPVDGNAQVDRFCCKCGDSTQCLGDHSEEVCRTCFQKDRSVHEYRSVTAVGRCYNCGKVGHRAIYCTEPKTRLNTKKGIRLLKVKSEKK